MTRKKTTLHILLAAMAVAVLAACASIGRPEGGPKDELPPVYVRSNPSPGELNFKENELTIYFDENIKVEDVMNKVVVSPVQKKTPRVSANGKRLSVQLQDTLLDDATYTIDFSDAIRDLNEGNILDGFAIDFSTGQTRDSLVISGMLFEARTLEPAQGMIVGVYSNLADSAITTLPFDRIAKTNQYGQFVIRNLAEGTYNIFAVNDINRDYHWDRSEDVAFYDLQITPTIEKIVVTDTLRASNGLDSIVMREGVRYLPNDLLLTWFNENYKSQYLKTYNRQDSTRIYFEFGAPADTFPIITMVNGPRAGRKLDEVAVLNHSGLRDTLTYWLADREVMRVDTLLLETKYLRTDTLDQLTWTTDTLKFVNKSEPVKEDKDKKKKKKGEDEAVNSIAEPEITFLDFNMSSRGNQDINKPLLFMSNQPVDSIKPGSVRLQVMQDTVWTDLGPQAIVRDSLNRLLNFALHHDWIPSAKYKLTIDSAAITSVYGLWNRPVDAEFTVKGEEEYSTIILNTSGYEPGEHLVVQLLNSSDNPVATAEVVGGTATFRYLTPGTYYARAFIDRNGNGLWDTGNVAQKIQPEDVYYYPKKLNLKKNWDIAQTWNINELPIDKQKPNDIKKNKPKTKEAKPQTDEEDEEEDDDFYNPGFGNNSRAGNAGFGASGARGMNSGVRPRY